MIIFLISLLSAQTHTVPVPQSLTLKEFRAEEGRSLEPINNFVIVSPSYRKVRRQGRKGENLPIKFPTLKVRDPNEINFATNEEHESETGPVFANSNNLKTEDIESKIRDINNSIKTNVSEPITTAEEVITKQETVKEQIEDWEVTTLSSAFGEEPSNTVIEEEVYKEDDVDVAPNKRIVLSLKTVHQFEHINEENIKEMLEKLSGYETSVLFNQKDSILQEEFTNPGHLIFVDAKVDRENKISGNVFSAGKPLDILEGLEYDEALSILNNVSKILEEILAASKVNKSLIRNLPKKIIVAIRTAVFISEETVGEIKDSLNEADVETVVFINAPEEVIRNEFTNHILPIFVSVSVDSVGVELVSGNVYYNSVPLENLNPAEHDEASDILATVTDVLKEDLSQQIIPETSIPITEGEKIRSKKVVISLKSSLMITDEESALLSSHITNRVEIPSILLVNRPIEMIQAELRGPAVPILLDMNIDQDYQLSGNILYNYQPLENIAPEEFDEAVNILNVVKEALTEQINTKLSATSEVTMETATKINISEVVEMKMIKDEGIFDESDKGTTDPESSKEDKEEATPEPTPEPEPKTSTEWNLEEISGAKGLELAEAQEVGFTEDNETVTKVVDEQEIGSLYFEEEEHLIDEIEFPNVIQTEENDNEEGSGFILSESDNTEVLTDFPHVSVEVLNHGVEGVTEVPGRTKSATPGVDFGLIQEITSY